MTLKSQNNEHEWYESLFKNMYAKLFRHLTSKISVLYFSQSLKNDIEDCIQDAFSDLWRNRSKLLKHKNIHAWLYVATSNKLVDRIRYYKSRPSSVSSDPKIISNLAEWEWKTAKEADSNASYEKDIRDRLDEIATVISQDTFDLLVEYYNKTISNNDLAEKHGISYISLHKRVHRQLTKIQEKFTIMMLIVSIFAHLIRYKVWR